MKTDEGKSSVVLFQRGSQMLARHDSKGTRTKISGTNGGRLGTRKGMGEEAVRHARSYAFEANGRWAKCCGQYREQRAVEPYQQRHRSTCTTGYRLKAGPVPLADIGISRKESARAQLLADLPEPVFEAVKAGQKTIAEVKREKRFADQVERAEGREKTVVPGDWIITAAGMSTLRCRRCGGHTVYRPGDVLDVLPLLPSQ